jgi:hypothetical protein
MQFYSPISGWDHFIAEKKPIQMSAGLPVREAADEGTGIISPNWMWRLAQNRRLASFSLP